MDSAYKFLLLAHGISGLIALVTFWVAAFAKKGSPLHLRFGKIYIGSMLGIVVTAIPMAVIIGWRGKVDVATFLVYLVVITASAMWMGRRAIRSKRDQTQFRGRAYLGVAALNLVASMVAFGIGLQMSDVLLMGFSAIGFHLGTRMLIRFYRPLTMTRWWMKEHISAMLGCGVATHIAFLAIGMNRIIDMLGAVAPSWYGSIAWFGPLVVAMIAGVWLSRKYVPKTSPGAAVVSRG